MKDQNIKISDNKEDFEDSVASSNRITVTDHIFQTRPKYEKKSKVFVQQQ
jgi:hypothetical protein